MPSAFNSPNDRSGDILRRGTFRHRERGHVLPRQRCRLRQQRNDDSAAGNDKLYRAAATTNCSAGHVELENIAALRFAETGRSRTIVMALSSDRVLPDATGHTDTPAPVLLITSSTISLWP